MNNNIKKEIFNTLKTDERIWNKSQTELNKTLLLDYIDKYDEDIIQLLFDNKETKSLFFEKINETYIFKAKEFKFFIEENKVNNSLTQYKNRIGLSDGKVLLKNTDEVVLDYPYKDCVLKGGQSDEEGETLFYEYDENVTKTQKKKGHEPNTYNAKKTNREEVFFNKILAKDEIDRLFDNKTFINWKRYTKKDSKKVKDINRNNDIINENIIIKGNNLLALHSLIDQFSNKIKLIYIDPPYNSGGNSDNFTYNNNFKHSTWLTFMKNRLEVSKEFLREDGFIAITIDHNELFYLGILADEVFGRDNYIGVISIVHKPEGRNQKKFIATSNEFMLIYAKNKDIAEFNNVIFDEEKKKEFTEKDYRGKYKLKNYLRKGGGDANLRKNKPHFYYPIYVDPNNFNIYTEKKEDCVAVYPIKKSGQERTWKTLKETFIERLEDNRIVAKKDKDDEIQIYEKYYMSETGELIKSHWTDKKYNAIHYGTNLLEDTIGRKAFSYPKSLYSVLDTLKIMTSENDIVMDFFAGSGTTGHATLKLNDEEGGKRRFVLIEQLNDHIDICIERNQKFLEKNNLNDSFIYAELAKWNEKAKDKINNCSKLDELINLFDDIYNKYFLNYNVEIKEFKEKIIHEENFKNLSLKKQKEIFIDMLDLNQLYIQKSEMHDDRYNLSEYDKKLNEIFYK